MAKNILWTLKVSEEFKDRLTTVAGVIDVPASQLVREAVNEKIERLAAEKPKVAEVLTELAA